MHMPSHRSCYIDGLDPALYSCKYFQETFGIRVKIIDYDSHFFGVSIKNISRDLSGDWRCYIQDPEMGVTEALRQFYVVVE